MLGVTAAPSGGCRSGGAAGEGGTSPGLTAPPFEEAAPGHFHCMLLGPNARLVTESQLLVVQSCELQAWRTTRGVDCMPRCMERVAVCLNDLKEVVEAAAALAAAAADAAAESQPSSPQQHQPGQQQPAAAAPMDDAAQQERDEQPAPASPFAAATAQEHVTADAADAAAAEQPVESMQGGAAGLKLAAVAALQRASSKEQQQQQGGEKQGEDEEEEQGEGMAVLQAMPTAASTLTCGFGSRRTTAGGASRRTTAGGRRASQLLSPREEGLQATTRVKAVKQVVERGASPANDNDELTPPTSGRPPSPPEQEPDAMMWYVNTQAVHSLRSSARESVDDGAAAAYGERVAAESGGGVTRAGTAEAVEGEPAAGLHQWLEHQRRQHSTGEEAATLTQSKQPGGAGTGAAGEEAGDSRPSALNLSLERRQGGLCAIMLSGQWGLGGWRWGGGGQGEW